MKENAVTAQLQVTQSSLKYISLLAGNKWREGQPIRVVMGYKGKKHSKFALVEGCR